MAERLQSTVGNSGGISILPPLNSGQRNNVSGAVTPRSTRSLSRKLQDMIKKQQPIEGGKCAPRTTVEKFHPANWKHYSDRELKKMSLIQRSRYLAYEPAPKEILERQMESLKRVRVRLMAEKEKNREPTIEDMIEKEWDSGLVGHLKAAEAKQRLKTMKLACEENKAEELAHLISSQPTAIAAVRLNCFLKPLPMSTPRQLLSKHEQEHCEALLEDDKGLIVNRTL